MCPKRGRVTVQLLVYVSARGAKVLRDPNDSRQSSNWWRDLI